MYKLSTLLLVSLRRGVCFLASTVVVFISTSVAAECNSVTIKGAPPLYINDGILRTAALFVANTRINEATVLLPVDPPTDPLRCSGDTPGIPAEAPTRQNYFGNVASKQRFLQLAAKRCMGAGNANQYFSMNKAIYVRLCGGGDYSNYIYFWGKQDLNPSKCFKSDYPSMFAKANANRKEPVTATNMASVYGKAGLSSDTQESYALGNSMAALLISESSRDHLVLLENYMLMDLAAAKTVQPDQVIGGRCVPHADVCQNPNKQDGVHPIAWGGAKEAMMAGEWGRNQGANSVFGERYESELIARWARKFAGVSTATGDQCPPIPKTWEQLTPVQVAFLQNLYAPLLSPNPRPLRSIRTATTAIASSKPEPIATDR
ncbi:hypothetical protein P3C29_24295 [Pseudomonas sp. 1912-s]|uniref:hypothetical protein n=1 Tax=Pseudomonas sp. 1912-s TaxID=3033802 RepID=UPI0023DF6400|nr:hypothetical protein [Pseudomonas sp. 1912-s]MDF3201817.1 hypothetical protein [Pseudomonas sp. 1912-s]